MKQIRNNDFGVRLRQLRMERGLTQHDFGKRVGLSQRMIAYYEGQAKIPPPGHFISRMANVLRVSADHLLGLKLIKPVDLPRDVRLLKRLHKILNLPRHHQRAILEHLDALATKASSRNIHSIS